MMRLLKSAFTAALLIQYSSVIACAQDPQPAAAQVNAEEPDDTQVAAADSSQQESAARKEILNSPEMREAISWTEASLKVRAGGGKEQIAEMHDHLGKMSNDELNAFLYEYQLARAAIHQEQQEFYSQRTQTFDKAFAFHLQQQTMAMQMASNRKAATFKKFDRGFDRYNYGFHGYSGPRRPLVGGGFFFGGRR